MAQETPIRTRLNCHPTIILTFTMGVLGAAILCWGFAIAKEDLLSLFRYFHEHDPEHEGSEVPALYTEIDSKKLEKYLESVLGAELYYGTFTYKIINDEDGIQAVMILHGGNDRGHVACIYKSGWSDCEWFNHEMVETISISTPAINQPVFQIIWNLARRYGVIMRMLRRSSLGNCRGTFIWRTLVSQCRLNSSGI